MYDGARKHIEDALIELWQANAAGRYQHPADDRDDVPLDPAFTGFGRCPSDFKTGAYSFLTIKPGPVPHPNGGLQAPHLSLIIQARGMLDPTYTRVYFSDEADANATDPVLATVPADRRRHPHRRKGGGRRRFRRARIASTSATRATTRPFSSTSDDEHLPRLLDRLDGHDLERRLPRRSNARSRVGGRRVAGRGGRHPPTGGGSHRRSMPRTCEPRHPRRGLDGRDAGAPAARCSSIASRRVGRAHLHHRLTTQDVVDSVGDDPGSSGGD